MFYNVARKMNEKNEETGNKNRLIKTIHPQRSCIKE